MPLITSDSLYKPFNPPSPLAPLSAVSMMSVLSYWPVRLRVAIMRPICSSVCVIMPGEDFHLAGIELLLLPGRQAVPLGNLRDAVGKLGAGGRSFIAICFAKIALARLVPAHVEFALVHIDVLLLHLMR